MTLSLPLNRSHPERAFLDANVIRGQLTNDLLLSLAARDVFDPRWTQRVLDEMRRNRPPGVPEAKIDQRIDAMNKYFPRGMTSVPDGLEPQMRADAKDQHVLAGAVHSRSDVLVTDNIKDFDPPGTGPHAMRVERLSEFFSRKLEEDPDRVRAAIEDLVSRNRRDPRTMSALIDKIAGQPELRAFAQKLNAKVPADQRGTAEVLTASDRHSPNSAAFDGLPKVHGTTKPHLHPTAQQQKPASAERDQPRGR